MRKLLISALGVIMVNLSIASVVPAQSDPDVQRIAKIERTVTKIGVDENVNVQFLDGSTAKGRITVIGDSSFVLVKKKTTDSMTIGFAQVKQVRRGGDDSAFSKAGVWAGIALIPLIIGFCFWARNKD